jgi:hypothetical protein
VPDAIQRCMPLDILRYLGAGVSSEDLYVPQGRPNRERWSTLPRNFPETVVASSTQSKIGVGRRHVEDQTLGLLDRRRFRVGDLPRKNWDDLLSEKIVAHLVLNTLRNEAHPSGLALYTSLLRPYQSDLSRAYITVHGGISINCRYPPPPDNPDALIKSGFGNTIPEEEAWLRMQSPSPQDELQRRIMERLKHR